MKKKKEKIRVILKQGEDPTHPTIGTRPDGPVLGKYQKLVLLILLFTHKY